MLKKIFLSLFIILIGITVTAQDLLARTLTLSFTDLPVEKALKLISHKGDFSFSYNSNVLPKQKQVSFTGTTTVRQILDLVLDNKFEYRQIGGYIVLKPSGKVTVQVKQVTVQQTSFTVEGYVLEEFTNDAISSASVIEKKQLAATLTGDDGYFKLKVKGKYKVLDLGISKESYTDTSIQLQAKQNQQVTVTLVPFVDYYSYSLITPEDYYSPVETVHYDTVTVSPQQQVSDSNQVTSTRTGSFLLSQKLKTQSKNLRNFFTERPFQISFTPGLSTRGKLSSQVINNFSFNVLGGYTGGLNGVEIGGLFNINQKYTRGLQIAGITNIVGGTVSGVQIAGIVNTNLSNVNGVQVAGISNYARKNMKGIQVSGITNFANIEMKGIQVAGIFNYAKKLKGVQIGLINIADSSEGYSIGLINIVMKGYHKLAFTSNEVQQLNVAFKTGNHKLYSILMAGASGYNQRKSYSVGYGLGTEKRITNWFSVNPEVSSQFMYLGNIFDLNLMQRFQLDFHINIGKHFSIFGGPAFSALYSNESLSVPGFEKLPREDYRTYKISDHWRGWIGWSAGLSIF
jgi:hypothetical protein